MAIDVTTFREDNSFIHSKPRTFYTTKIPRQHSQLCNLLSTTEPDFVYFASKYDIYALHIPSRKRERLATLQFAPCCLAASDGWICVGGQEKGQCAFINIGESRLTSTLSTLPSDDADVDALLPLDLDPTSRRLFEESSNGPSIDPFQLWRPAKVQYHEIGSSIVNSVTIHKYRRSKDGLQDEVVAVLSNNDETVRIWSLTQSRLLKTLDFPTFMNHATISPDGELLLACGDKPQAFFCKRMPLTSLTVDGALVFARYEWQEIARPKLTLALHFDNCFATAFSPSGHICAVASEVGTITIYNTRMIKEDMDADEAVIDVLRSSRPSLDQYDKRGAVRSMAFSPEPWDLFAWAEDHSRVCITDLRDDFRTRQTIELDIYDLENDRVDLSDPDEEWRLLSQRGLEIEARFVRHHQEALDAEDHLAAINYATDYIELTAERRRLARDIRTARRPTSFDPSDPHDLRDDGRQLLESLRVEPPDRAESDPVLEPTFDFSAQYRHARLQMESPLLHLANTPPYQNTSIHQYTRERNLERMRTNGEPRNYTPRRRSSIVINSNASNPSSSSHRSFLAPISSSTTLSTSPSRLASTLRTNTSPSTRSQPTSLTPLTTAPLTPLSSLPFPPPSVDPWQTISAAMATASAAMATASSSVSHFEHRMQQMARLERQRVTRHQITTAALRGIDDVRELNLPDMADERPARRREYRADLDRLGTMGIGWSGDGRFLYVGTEEGIMELKVNIAERKTFPAASLI